MNKMKNPDIEIYLKNFMKFFQTNPNDLTELIGSANMDVFYNKIREQCEKNYSSGQDIVVTRTQLMNIIYDIKKPKVNYPHQQSKFGAICLN